MKNAKRQLAWFLSMLMVFTLIFSPSISVDSARKKTVKLKKIVLNHSTYKLQKGKRLKLKAKFKPKKTTQKKITWKSSKKKIAKVSKKGVVTALKPGKTKITAKVKGTKKKATCKITVVNKKNTPSQAPSNNNPPGGGDVSAPSQQPTATPSPTPKYDRPSETAPPVNRIDLTAKDAFYTEALADSDVVKNADGSITITFSQPNATVNFCLPDNAQTYYSNYKSVVLTYTSEGGNLGYSLFDADMVGKDNLSAGKHTGTDAKVVESKNEKQLIFAVTNDCAGGCIRGFQLVNPNKTNTGKPITITIKSIIFCDKEKPTEEDLKPTETAGPTLTPSPTATATSTATSTATNTATSTATTTATTSASPSTTPKYDPPSETAPPVKTVDITASDAFHNEASGNATISTNADGSLTVTFLKQYAAINYYLPDNAQNYYSNYKSVVLTYTSSGGNLGHALYDTEMVGSANSNAGKHPDWGQKIVEAPQEKTITFAVTDKCVGNCIRGFQIFNPNALAEGESITITIKSLIFCDKENPSIEDLKPTNSPTSTATTTSTATATTTSTATATSTATSTPTSVVGPTTTPTPTTTTTATATSTATATATSTATTTTTATATSTATATATSTATATATSTATTTTTATATTPASPTATPKYDLPDETAPPLKTIDITAEDAFHNEAKENATIVANEDGSLTVTFLKQYAAINYYLPDNAQNYYSNYKSVALTYTSSGGNLGHALYDAEMVGSSNSNAGKHPDWSQKISESLEEKTLIFSVTNDCVGNCIRGFQIFNPNALAEGQSITINIKSLIFSDKENPSIEDLKPTPEPTPEPTATPTPAPNDYGITHPAADDENITWQCLTFGSYYQSQYSPKQAPQNPVEGTEYTDSDNTEMIYQGGKYYKKEPIKWRILSADGNNAFLIADQNLDSQCFHNEYCNETSWAASSIRQWLNEQFYSRAFTEEEKAAILDTQVTTEKNPEFGTSSGNTVTDKLYLLSADEIKNAYYGFSIDSKQNSLTRQAKNTAYAQANGAWTNNEADYAGNGWWWLRSSGSFGFNSVYVGTEGFADYSGFLVVNTGGAVRPVMHIDLGSELWKTAEPVSLGAAADLSPTPAPTENPVKQIDLSTVNIAQDIGYYDYDSDTIHVNDTRTGTQDSTFMHFPIPVTVAPNQKLRVTISGTSWGTDDFRIWTTPIGGETSGDFVQDANVYLRPTVQDDGSFTGTVTLTAAGGKDENNPQSSNSITLKAEWDTRIQNLIISDIKVELIQ